MARAQLASLGVGIAQNPSGATLANVGGTIYFHNTSTPVPIYSAEVGGTVNSTGAFTTDSFGRLPGWIDEGQTVDITIPPAPTITAIISIDSTTVVASVFGRSGAVTAANGDYSVGQVTGAAPLASPALTGTPTAPTQTPLDNSTKLSTTAYSDAADALLVPLSQKGAVNGVGSLDSTGRQPIGQAPLSVASGGQLPTGLTGQNSYDPLRGIYNGKATYLRRARAALAKALQGSGVCNIFCEGDSVTQGVTAVPGVSDFPHRLRQLLAAGYPIAGTGFVSCWSNGSIDSRWSFTPGPPAAGAGTHWNASSNYGFQIYSQNNADTATFTSDVAGTIVNIYYWNANGTWTYKIDGNAPVTVTPGSDFTLKKITVSGLPNIAHTVVLTNTSAGVGGMFAGAQVTNTTGVEVHNIGMPGVETSTDSAGWQNASGIMGANFVAALAVLTPPDLTFFCLGINDAVGGRTASAYQTNMTTILGTITGDLALWLPPTPSVPADGTSFNIPSATWLTYQQAMVNLSDTLARPMVNVGDRFGTWATANANGVMTPGDGVHPNANGYEAIAQVLGEIITEPLPLPASVVSSSSIGYLSLRNDFALSPSMSAGALTTGIQSAITAAISAGKGLDLGADLWQINAPLTIGGNLGIRAAGAAEVWSNVANSNNTEMPGAAPWYQGGGFVQTAVAADILQVTAPGVKLDLKSLVLAFSCGSATFANTGHAVNGMLQGNYNGQPDNGITMGRWDDVLVFGHDGNHYAFATINMNYLTGTHMRTYGGGGILMKCQSAASGYGNSVIVNPYFVVICNGTADGIRQESTDNGNTYYGVENLNEWVRPQCNLGSIAGTPLALAFPQITPPATVGGIANQFTWRDINTAPRNTTLSAPLSTGSAITSLPVNATSVAIPTSRQVTLNDGAGHTQVFIATTTTTGGATSIPVSSATPNFAYPASTTSVFSGRLPDSNVIIAPDLEGTGADFFIGSGTQTVGQVGNDPRNPLGITTYGVGAQPFQTNAAQNNTAVGYQALAVNANSSQNTAVGSQALASLTSNGANTAMGYQALQSVTGGSYTAVGTQALAAATANGFFTCTAVGSQALKACTTGVQNTAVGFNTLLSVTTAGQSTAIGDSALQSNTSSQNTAVGALAMQTSSTANQSVAIGYNAFQPLTTGNQNVAIGANTGQHSLTGTSLVFVGYGAGSSSVDVSYATAIGASAGTNANFSTAIGQNAQVTAQGGVAIGIDHNGGNAQATVQDAFVLGTALHQIKISNNATGAGSAALGANSPAVTNTAPYTWFKMTSNDGSTVYVPCWK